MESAVVSTPPPASSNQAPSNQAPSNPATTARPLSYRPPMRPPAKLPLSQRVNMRMVIFGLVMLMPVGYIVYDFLDSVITGGIKDIGGGYKLVDLKAMSNFPLDQVAGKQQDIPQKWRDLDGQKVVLYGEMWQPFSANSNDVAGFDLCYSISKCCFNGPPQVQHFVRSRVVPGKSLNYYPNLVKVTGTLHVHLMQEAGRVSSVYQLDVVDIQPST
jgi:hypothetical protein